jgi:peptidoglycan/LPS O-acetylase OafA/YrhL
LALAAACASHYLVERPFLRLRSRLRLPARRTPLVVCAGAEKA